MYGTASGQYCSVEIAFYCAFNFAHLARCAAAIFLREAADIVRFGVPPFALLLTFAQRAL